MEYVGKEYYDSISEGYTGLHGEEQRKKAQIISQMVSLRKTDTLLDVGCGPGIGSSTFDCRKTGLDSSKDLLKGFPGKQVLGRAEDLPFQNRSFDLVMSVTAVHNFSDIGKALNEMKRVSKGLIVITILRRSGRYPEIMDLISKQFKIEKREDEEKDTILLLRCES